MKFITALLPLLTGFIIDGRKFCQEIKKMKLQMDGALNYGKYSHIKITPARIRNDKTSYNTYKYKGIPNDPVCNVSLPAIRAAIFPAQTDYLYFMKNKSGKHDFTRYYSTHIGNINRATK